VVACGQHLRRLALYALRFDAQGATFSRHKATPRNNKNDQDECDYAVLAKVHSGLAPVINRLNECV